MMKNHETVLNNSYFFLFLFPFLAGVASFTFLFGSSWSFEVEASGAIFALGIESAVSAVGLETSIVVLSKLSEVGMLKPGICKNEL